MSEDFEIPYEFIFLTAFNNLSKYGHKTEVPLSRLAAYYEKFIESARENAIEEGFENFTVTDEIYDEALEEFLNHYSDFFYLDGDSIAIYDDADMEEIYEQIIQKECQDEIEPIFDVPYFLADFVKELCTPTAYNMIDHLLGLEYQIEKAYVDYVNNPTLENKKALAARKVVKAIALHNLDNYSHYHYGGFASAAESHLEDHLHQYDVSPVNDALWDAVPHRFDSTKQFVFGDNKQYAIFSNKPLSCYKLAEQLFENLNVKKVEEDETTKSLVKDLKKLNNMDRLYYGRYLKYLDEYIRQNGSTPDLLQTKARLSYYMDGDTEASILDHYEEDKGFEGVKVPAEQIQLFADEAEFFILELFSVPEDPFRLRKLIMMKTYYSITRDKEFLDIFEVYSDEPRYDNYKQFIFGKNKTLTL